MRLQPSFQNLSQCLPAAQYARLHCTERDFENRGNFLVAQILDVPQNYSRSEFWIQLLERGFYQRARFMIRGLIEGRPAGIGEAVDMRRCAFVLPERHLLPLMARKPAAMIVSLIHRDAIDPSL